MAVTSSNMSFLLDEVVSGIAYESFMMEPLMMPALYSVRPSSRRRERLASFGGLRPYQAKTAMSAPATGAIVQQAEKDFVHTAYAQQVPIERELLDDQDFGLLEDIGRQLGTQASYSMDLLAMAVFNDAFDGVTYTDQFGLSLCNSAHLNADSGNSQDNSGTSALSMSSVKSTRTAMRNFTNHAGDAMSVQPDALLIPVDLEEDAWEIVRSTGRPDTASRADNFYNGQFKLFVSPLLSTGFDAATIGKAGDANDWFMLDTRLMAQNLIWFQRIGLEIYGDGNLQTGTRTVGGYFRSSHGVRDWRFIYGHEVA
jgi:hypothetical protein